MTRYAAFTLLLLAAAAPAHAQTRGFVEGAALVDSDPTLRSQTSLTAGVSGSAGLFITPRWSLRLEADYPWWHRSHRTGESLVVDRIEAFDLTEEGRAPSLSFLVGRHYGEVQRARFAWVTGVTAARRDFRTSGWTEKRDLQGDVIEHRDAARDMGGYTWLALTGGADVTIPVTKSIAVVPQIRVHTYGGLSEHTADVFVRPRLGVRWTF